MLERGVDGSRSGRFRSRVREVFTSSAVYPPAEELRTKSSLSNGDRLIDPFVPSTSTLAGAPCSDSVGGFEDGRGGGTFSSFERSGKGEDEEDVSEGKDSWPWKRVVEG